MGLHDFIGQHREPRLSPRASRPRRASDCNLGHSSLAVVRDVRNARCLRVCRKFPFSVFDRRRPFPFFDTNPRDNGQPITLHDRHYRKGEALRGVPKRYRHLPRPTIPIPSQKRSRTWSNILHRHVLGPRHCLHCRGLSLCSTERLLYHRPIRRDSGYPRQQKNNLLLWATNWSHSTYLLLHR
ncbi:hypothetical protein BDV98DRAFT_282290 [Pterulicium gracile]|uniref:Uncharacterized protein n=1 Tax=Pterulicium gracile TaxID=1884261 RepID=A0A5C3QWW6_9AGAR|nr:hypothetical protein BDV98DRAFT_282290 [Pterula gracilis]